MDCGETSVEEEAVAMEGSFLDPVVDVAPQAPPPVAADAALPDQHIGALQG